MGRKGPKGRPHIDRHRSGTRAQWIFAGRGHHEPDWPASPEPCPITSIKSQTGSHSRRSPAGSVKSPSLLRVLRESSPRTGTSRRTALSAGGSSRMPRCNWTAPPRGQCCITGPSKAPRCVRPDHLHHPEPVNEGQARGPRPRAGSRHGGLRGALSLISFDAKERNNCDPREAQELMRASGLRWRQASRSASLVRLEP